MSDTGLPSSAELAQQMSDTPPAHSLGVAIEAPTDTPPPAASASWEQAQQAQPLTVSQQPDAAKTAEAPTPPPAASPSDAASPFDVASTPPPLIFPGTPQQQPTPPQAPQAAPAVQVPGALTPQQQRVLEMKQGQVAGERYYNREGKQPRSALDEFALGGKFGLATLAQQGKDLSDYLTNHVSSQKDNWQLQADPGLPPEQKADMPYQAGKAIGEALGYGAAGAAVSAAVPLEVPAAATGLGAAALRVGGQALEGAIFGGAGAIHEAKEQGKEPTAGDIAGGAAIGGVGQMALTKAASSIGNVVLKPAAKRLMGEIQKFAEAAQGEIIKGEQASLKATNDAMAAGTAPVTAIAKKQMELTPGLRNEIDAEIDRLDAIAKGGKGPVRGVRRGLGYQRAYGATPIAQILKKLPDAIAHPYEAAVNEIAEAKLLVENLKKQVVAYAEHAINLAKTPADQARITKEIEEHGDLKHQANDTLSKVRAYLFGEMQKLQAMTHPAAHLEISDLKHVQVHADAEMLQPTMEAPKKTFVAAARQAESAKMKLVNAEKHLEGLREKHQPLFEQVDAHLGTPTSARVIAGHPSFGDKQTVVSVGLQYNPSKAHLTGRYLMRYRQIEAGIKAVERNWKEKITYKVAHNGRVTLPGAAKLLREAGLIHPTTKGLLLAGALGAKAFFDGTPANAAGMNDADTPQQTIWNQAMLPGAIVGVVLARKFGPAGARQIARSSRFIFHFLYEDTQSLAGMADHMMGQFRGGALHEMESLANAMQEYRGKLMQAHFLPDAHGAIAPALVGDADALAKLTPEARKFVGECQQLKNDLRSFVRGYVEEFDTNYKALPKDEQLGAMEIRNAIHVVNQAFNGGGKIKGAGDYLLEQLFAREAAFNFTLNWKIAATAWLHDTAAYGGMQLGVPSVYAAYGQYAGSPTLRGLVNRMHIGGAASEAAQDLNHKAGVYTVEAIHTRLAFLGSLNKQFNETAPEQLHHLGVTSANDYAEKVMTMRLPNENLTRIYEEAALDVSRATGSDVSRLNKLGTERGFILPNIIKYNRYVMLDQRLVKTTVQDAVSYFSQGKTALGMQKLGRLAHALAIKAQYGGTKTLLPVTVYAVAMGNSYTAPYMAEVAKKIDDLSLGLGVFGNMGEHGRWDPVMSPLMGQRLPGFDDGIEAFKQIMELSGNITKMQQVLASGDPLAVVTGSKQDEDVKKGQAAVIGIMNMIGFLAPKIAHVPTRFIRDAAKALPDIANHEFNVGVPSPWPIGEKTKPAAPAKLMEYADQPGQTPADVDTEMTADAMLELLGRQPGRRQRAFAQSTYAKNAASKAGSEAPDLSPEEAGALSAK